MKHRWKHRRRGRQHRHRPDLPRLLSGPDRPEARCGSHCLSGVDENIAANFPQGGIVVAGRSFGCGSSREHAPIALLNMGAKAVIADSLRPHLLPQCGQSGPCSGHLQGHQQKR
ncbi:MAG: hypothetical protein ACLVJH_04195 [Faecalibacterium prausnitzii]